MSKLTINEAASCGYTDVIKLGYQDLIDIVAGTNPFTGLALDTAGQLTIATLPAGGGVTLCSVIETVAMVGSTSVVFDIGTTAGDPDEFINNLDVDGMTTGVAVSNTGDAIYQSAATTTVLLGNHPVAGTAADQDIILEVTDAAAASLTAGEVLIGLKINNLAQFSSANN